MEEQTIITLLSGLKHHIFPRPFERLAVSGHHLVGVEIGVYKAEHALSLLTYLDIHHLYLIDPYELYEEYDEGKAHYGIDQDALHLAIQEARQRLALYTKKITWVFQKSSESLDIIPEQLDFVYIDGNHQEVFIRHDIEQFFPKIRHGGVIGGHDFYNGYCRDHDGVIQAVMHFAVEQNLSLQVELPDWWITKI